LDRHIESGGYGDVYLGHNHSTGEDVAVKIGEERSIEVILNFKITEINLNFKLEREYKIYKELESCKGFPKVFYHGELNKRSVLVMEILGSSLEVLHAASSRKFSFGFWSFIPCPYLNSTFKLLVWWKFQPFKWKDCINDCRSADWTTWNTSSLRLYTSRRKGMILNEHFDPDKNRQWLYKSFLARQYLDWWPWE